MPLNGEFVHGFRGNFFGLRCSSQVQTVRFLSIYLSLSLYLCSHRFSSVPASTSQSSGSRSGEETQRSEAERHRWKNFFGPRSVVKMRRALYLMVLSRLHWMPINERVHSNSIEVVAKICVYCTVYGVRVYYYRYISNVSWTENLHRLWAPYLFGSSSSLLIAAHGIYKFIQYTYIQCNVTRTQRIIDARASSTRNKTEYGIREKTNK